MTETKVSAQIKKIADRKSATHSTKSNDRSFS